ncbi:MAG: VOC family protein [Anaerolineae bacterium]|nr:VOC family protein [Anaerolineae bacterium]
MNGQEEPQKTRLAYCVQIGAVVRDVQATMDRLSSTFGIGPWHLYEWPRHRENMKGRYRGQPGNFRFLMAFAQMGHVELELVQPLEGESIYTEFLREKGEGLHHIHFDLPDVQQALASWREDGVATIQSGTGLRPGAEWAYLNTAELPSFGGILVEISTKVYEGDESPPRA